MLEVLERDPKFSHIVARVSRCDRYRPCNCKWCPVCSNPRRRKSKRHLDPTSTRTPGFCELTNTKRGGLSTNYQVAAGQRMVEPFVGLPNIMLHPITINWGVLPLGANLSTVKDRIRREIYDWCDSLGPGVIMRGKIDFVLKWADELANEFPDTHLPPNLSGRELPHRRIAMLHVHVVLYHPIYTKPMIRSSATQAFPGKKRVCVRSATENIVHDDGTVTHGVQGYLEYSSLGKVEIEFGNQSTEAVIEFAELDSTWNRANQNLSYGRRTCVVPSEANPYLVRYLEAADNFECLLNDYPKADFGRYHPYFMLIDGPTVFRVVKAHQSVDPRSFQRLFMSFWAVKSLGLICNSSRRLRLQVADPGRNFPFAACQTSESMGRGQSP